MNSVPNSERKHIVFAGRRNTGKSSLINAFVGQPVSIISDTPGTTTDPVRKAIELLPYGPVVLIDTAGIDDIGELGQKRISKTIKAISSADFAVVVLDARETLSTEEIELLIYLDKISVPYLIAVNKVEFGVNPKLLKEIKYFKAIHFEVSCKEKAGIEAFKKNIIRHLPRETEPPLVGDIVNPADVVVMVVPIDAGAPKGRLILPQVQTIREALDESTIVLVVKERELRAALYSLKSAPDLVITDSQAIKFVAEEVPVRTRLTTFSILMARHKGDLIQFIQGLRRVNELCSGDKVLIAESCSHHPQADDIGRIKIPGWLKEHTGKELDINIVSGLEFPENIADYKLIIHCGGCMLSRKAMQMRLKEARLMDVPIVNYGLLISYMHGALPRVLSPFEDALYEWNRLQSELSRN